MMDYQTRRDVLRGLGVGTGGLTLGVLSSPVSARTRFCPKTVGYWKNHTDQWIDDDDNLLERMWVAGDPYPSLPEFAEVDETTVLDILTEPPRGDKSIIMVHQRIAAQLNYWASSTCDRSDLAYARATAWLWAFDEPIVDDDGTIGFNQRKWDVEVPETEIETSAIDVTVEAGTYGESVKDALEQYNEGDLCPCTVED